MVAKIVLALAYEPPTGETTQEPLCIAAGGSHRVLTQRGRATQLIDSVMSLCAHPGARLTILDQDVSSLTPACAAALRARIAVLPALGGLISYLNAWENITLPIGFNQPARLPHIGHTVLDLIAGFGLEPHAMLRKMPSELSPYERTVAAWVRVILESPDLVLGEPVAPAPPPGLTAFGFYEAYHASHREGTFIQLEEISQT